MFRKRIDLDVDVVIIRMIEQNEDEHITKWVEHQNSILKDIYIYIYIFLEREQEARREVRSTYVGKTKAKVNCFYPNRRIKVIH